MAELTQGKVKRQAKLLELLTRRQNQIFKVEQKKEIVPTIINNEVYLQDDNLYCVCRKKFLEGQPMICTNKFNR
jgi:bromodomain and PHD finger-containing protein 1